MTIPFLYSQFSPAADFYTRIMSSLYHNQYRLYDPDYGLLRDADVYEKLFRDPDIAGALYKRFHDVAGRVYNVEPYSDDIDDRSVAGIVRDGMRQCENMMQARSLLARACLYGRTYAFVRSGRKVMRLGDDRFPQSWWVPLYLECIDKRRVEYVPVVTRNEDGTEHLRTQKRIFSIAENKWQDVSPEADQVLMDYVYNDEEGRLGYGRPSLGEPLFFYQRFIAVAMEKGLQALERFVGGLRVIKMASNPLASVGKDNETVRDKYKTEFEKAMGHHIVVMSKDDEMEVHDLPANAQAGVIEWVKMLKQSCVALILGSVRPTGGGEGGSLARTSEEAETTESLIQFDRANLDDVMTHSLIKPFMRHNRPQLIAAGHLKAIDRLPRFRTQQEKREDYSKNSADLKVLIDAGVALKADEVYRKIGYTQPSENDETLVTQPKPQANPSPFGGGLPGMPPDLAGDRTPAEPTQTPELPKPPAPPEK